MKHHFHVILILLLPLIAVLGYAKVEYPTAVEFTQINLASVDSFFHNTPDTALVDSLQSDSVVVDSAPQRILFVGDSMVGGLGPFMAKYAHANGHQLTYVTWPSSTTYAWSSDTLIHFIRKANPTFIMLSIGGNEQPLRDTRQAEENIKKIISIVGDIPYVWICTPAWKKEAAFNFVPERLCGPKRFYDSRHLELPRGGDKMHPDRKGYQMWMDSVAIWMGDPEKTAHPILMNPYPKDTPSNKCEAISLKPNSRLNFGRTDNTPKRPAHTSTTQPAATTAPATQPAQKPAQPAPAKAAPAAKPATPAPKPAAPAAPVSPVTPAQATPAQAPTHATPAGK